MIGAERLSAILAAVRDNFELEKDAEVTFETNPAVLDVTGFARLRSAGFNRASIGVQSVDARTLEALGRSHGAAESHQAVSSAYMAGFRSICVDFMSAVPRHYLSRRVAPDLSMLRDGRLGHASVYQFALCDGTPAKEMVDAGVLVMAGEEEAAAEYIETSDFLEKIGFIHYEVSNFARGEQFVSRHNSAYWNGCDYLGAGVAAVSTIEDERRTNTRDLKSYLKADLSSDSHYTAEKLGERERAAERLMLGLRTRSGISAERLGDAYYGRIEENLKEYIKKIEAEGLAIHAEGRIRLTSRGFLVMNGIAARFLAAMEL